MYESLVLNSRNVITSMEVSVRFSKNLLYEKPYDVIGIITLTGLKKAPKYVCIDRFIGTWKT
jgi:hypothetical protein